MVVAVLFPSGPCLRLAFSKMLALVLLATAAVARVMDSVPAVPEGWKFVRSAKLSDPVVLKIALRQQGAEALERATLEVSTPGHPNYGMHLSREEVRALAAPSDAAVADVSDWLQRYGIQAAVDNDWITITTTVSSANQLLDADFAWYQDENSSSPKLRTLSYSVPDELASHVDMLQPTTPFGQLAPRKSTIFSMQYARPAGGDSDSVGGMLYTQDTVPSRCNSRITPDCLTGLYNIHYKPSAAGNLIAFASFLEEYARYDDLVTAQTQFIPAAKGQNFTVVKINGGLDDQTSSSDSGTSRGQPRLTGRWTLTYR